MHAHNSNPPADYTRAKQIQVGDYDYSSLSVVSLGLKNEKRFRKQ